MVRSFLSTWIEGRRRKSRVDKLCRAKRPTFQPRLEALEERTLMNAGALDPTFGNGGVAINSIANFSNQWVLGVQPDGKLLEASGGNNGLNLLRTNTDGSAGAAESARADFHQEYLARQGLTASFAKCCVPRGEVACPAVRPGDLIKR